MDFNNSFFSILIIPFIISLIITLGIRISFRNNSLKNLSTIGVGISIVASYLYIIGIPKFNFDQSFKIPYIIIFSIIFGFFLDLLIPKLDFIRRVLIISIPLLFLIWVSSSSNTDLNETVGLIKFIIAFIITVILGFSLSDHDNESNEISILLLMASLGIAFLSKLSGDNNSFQVCLIISSSISGLIVISILNNKFILNTCILIGVGAPVVTLGNNMVFNSNINPISFLLLVLIFFVDKFIILPSGLGKINSFIRAMFIIFASMIIILSSISIYFLDKFLN